MKIIKINVSDMSCAMCAKSIEGTFSDRKGIYNATVNLADGYVRIKYDEKLWSVTQLSTVIKETGYTPSLVEEKNVINWFLIRIGLSIILTIPLLWTMLSHGFLSEDLAQWLVPLWLRHPITQWLLATPIQWIIGWSFYKGAFYNLKNKSLGMDVLVTLATTTAYVYSVIIILLRWNEIMMGHFTHIPLYFEASSTIITVILIGHYLEDKVKQRTSQALNELMELTVKEALLIQEGVEKEVPVEMLQVDDIVRVKKGEKVPLDGVIIEGESSFDESMMTGENLPVHRLPLDPVIGSTLNLSQTVLVKVTKVAGDTLLSQIINAVEEAQAKKPKIQRIADLIASLFVPFVVSISIFAYLYHYYYSNPGDISLAFNAAIAVLVISCPCALGLATPMSIMVGTSEAAKRGILYRSGDVFERINTITAVAFDKTGTLTEGRPSVLAFEGGRLGLVLAMETVSSHPLANALKQFAELQGAKVESLSKIEEIPGQGMKAYQGEKLYFLGSSKWIGSLINIDANSRSFIDNQATLGRTVVILSDESKVIAMMALADPIKPSSSKAIQKLHEKGIKTYLISGDQRQVAESIAHSLNIDLANVYAEVSPFDKAKIIREIQSLGHQVAFVGDGINDAVALQQADLGMAIGQGTSIAMENSDVTLLNSDLLTVAHTLTISRAVLNNIKWSFAWAFSYNLVAIPIAFLGLLSPLVSGIAMAFSDVTVVLNALRLKRIKE